MPSTLFYKQTGINKITAYAGHWLHYRHTGLSQMIAHGRSRRHVAGGFDWMALPERTGM